MPGQLQAKVGDRISKLFCARAAIDLPLLPEKDGQKAKLPMSLYIHSLEHPSTVGTGPWLRLPISDPHIFFAHKHPTHPLHRLLTRGYFFDIVRHLLLFFTALN
ncbi:hypothetical protein J1N35_032211 [Gossypium stocksii]|uniref:Uncharacterized protein n=1 Tax=Gossypium stocksii TaxID=47602 RepID=A0A9D3ZWH2_9ROSI|nr:hypothetical protein J1N35_032211 [Gossypium stocksii]